MVRRGRWVSKCVWSEPPSWTTATTTVGPIRALAIHTEILEFEGTMQQDNYIDWLQTLERIFDLRDVPNNIKVKLIAIKLKKTCFVMVGTCAETTPSGGQVQGGIIGQDEELVTIEVFASESPPRIFVILSQFATTIVVYRRAYCRV